MGYTDQGRYVGFTPLGTTVGFLPTVITAVISGPVGPGLVANLTTGEVSGELNVPVAFITVTAGTPTPSLAPVITPTGFCVAGTGPIGTTGTLQFTPNYVSPKVPTASPVPMDITSQVTLRGLPPLEVAKFVGLANGSVAGAGAIPFPVMNLGVGAHADSHVMAKHSHSHDEGEVGSHMAIRQIGMGSLAALENDDFSAPKTVNSLGTNMVLQALQLPTA